jgi:membrane carboxypeptidase/penicillin-binding protein
MRGKRNILIVFLLLMMSGLCYAQADILTYTHVKEKKVADGTFIAVSSYVVAMSVIDIETTYAVIRNGGHECNPLVKPFIKNRAYMYGVQLSVDALFIYLSYEMKGSKHKEFNKIWFVAPMVLGTTHGVMGGLNFRYVY